MLKEKIIKQTAAKQTVEKSGEVPKVLHRRTEAPENITKSPQNIYICINASIIKAVFGITHFINEPKEAQPSSEEKLINIYETIPKKIDARTMPVTSVLPARLKYSNISRPEAKPAPITSPIKTDETSNTFFNITNPFMLLNFMKQTVKIEPGAAL